MDRILNCIEGTFINNIPLGDNSMDIIVADWVLEHVQHPTELCSEIDRIFISNKNR